MEVFFCLLLLLLFFFFLYQELYIVTILIIVASLLKDEANKTPQREETLGDLLLEFFRYFGYAACKQSAKDFKLQGKLMVLINMNQLPMLFNWLKIVYPLALQYLVSE